MRKEVLIIDDEMDFRLSLAEMLVDLGFHVCTARNGIEAMEHLLRQKENPPHLITLDISMPEDDGLAFERKLRASNFQIPLIVISGLTLPQRNTFSAKAMLQKPLHKHELKAILEYCQI